MLLLADGCIFQRNRFRIFLPLPCAQPLLSVAALAWAFADAFTAVQVCDATGAQ